MKKNIWKYIRSRPGMPAVVKCVAYESKANVTADYDNIKYYFQAPQDHDPTGSSHWGDLVKGVQERGRRTS